MKELTPHSTFRFERHELDQLDWIVAFEVKRRSPAEFGPKPTRTSVLRSLIADRHKALVDQAKAKDTAAELAIHTKDKSGKTKRKDGKK